MRHSGWAGALLAVAAVAITGAARADDAPAARAIIDKAIQASGGADKIDKYRTHSFEEKGTYYGMGAGLPYTAKAIIQRPNKMRLEITNVFTLVVNGNNVLAIQGLNAANDPTDFLISPAMTGLLTSTGPETYFSPPTPGAPNGGPYGVRR